MMVVLVTRVFALLLMNHDYQPESEAFKRGEKVPVAGKCLVKPVFYLSDRDAGIFGPLQEVSVRQE
jgi:hypothetical protein